VSPIDAYLAELRRRLSPATILRWRFLDETESHLRDAAASFEQGGMAPDEAEHNAIERFGPAHLVARDLAGELAVRSLFQAALVTLVCLVLFVVPLYGIPENTFPPAPWPEGEMPGHLEWKRDAVLGLFAGAATLTSVALAGSRLGRVRFSLGVLGGALATIVLGVAFSTVLGIEWRGAVPGVPAWSIALSIVGECVLALLALLAVTRPLVYVRAAMGAA
jgi:hypothetical protein